MFGTARMVTDFDSYELTRVGLIPWRSDQLSENQLIDLQSAFYSELSRSTNFEIISLKPSDLEEIPTSDPVRRGWYKPRTILEISDRYQLDGVLIGTITDAQTFHPQRLSIQVDLVSSETGVPLWTASMHIDAADDRVRDAVQRFYSHGDGENSSGEPWELALLSPRRFTRFAAWQISRLL